MKILLIQTAFVGDVILATAVIEKIKEYYVEAEIDFLVQKGNESLLENNPKIRKILTFNKRNRKYQNLLRLLREIRKSKYDKAITIQRFLTSGILCAFSGAREKIGFDKNPLSFLFHRRIKHIIGSKDTLLSEVDRNISLVSSFTDNKRTLPKLYPSEADFQKVKSERKYICIAPASVWFTKQYPVNKWIEMINHLSNDLTIYLIGGKGDIDLCDSILNKTIGKNVINLAGQLTFLQSAALLKNAVMNFVNDSSPLHMASAMNAPVTAVFCSTLPSFGFFPLSDRSFIIETEENLYCRPCGLHGKRSCPEGHFRCADINVVRLLDKITG